MSHLRWKLAKKSVWRFIFICQKEKYFHLPPYVNCPDTLSIEARLNASLLAWHVGAHKRCAYQESSPLWSGSLCLSTHRQRCLGVLSRGFQEEAPCL